MTLTVAGLAMGMMIFLIASGLTLVFGLMDVINFGHGVFISVGAYCDADRARPAGRLGAGGFACAQSGAAGPVHRWWRWSLPASSAAVFERVIIMPVYGST